MLSMEWPLTLWICSCDELIYNLTLLDPKVSDVSNFPINCSVKLFLSAHTMVVSHPPVTGRAVILTIGHHLKV